MQEMQVQSLGQEDPLEKEMATQSSILAWRTPWTEEPVRLQSVSSVQFSRSFVSNSLRPHESQHARPLCPSPSPGVHSNSRPSSPDAIQPSHPLSSPSPPAPNPSQHQALFQWVNSSHEVAKVLEFQSVGSQKVRHDLVSKEQQITYRMDGQQVLQYSTRNYI